jgi:hypothetical protein
MRNQYIIADADSKQDIYSEEELTHRRAFVEEMRAQRRGGFNKALLPPRELDDHDRAVLLSRYVDPALVENIENFWTTEDPGELKALGFPYISSNGPRGRAKALVIRIRRPDGTYSHQLRPHAPRGSAKYIGKKDSGGDVHVAAASFKHLGNPRIPLAITESPIKAEALSRPWACGAVLCAIGVFGVYGWRGKNDKGGKAVSPQLSHEEIAWRGVDDEGNEFGRTAYIIMDSNIKSNSGVLDAARRLGGWMRSKGADVHYIGLPEPAND